MEDFGYWIFLLILYLFSVFMKKKKQKAAYRKMEEEEEEENGWEAPGFIKELLPDLVETEDEQEEEIVPPVVETVDYDAKIEPSPEYKSEVPLEKIHRAPDDLSLIDDDDQIGTIRRKFLKKEILKTSFFKNQQNVRMAVIYKEILDKPRALRRRFR